MAASRHEQPMGSVTGNPCRVFGLPSGRPVLTFRVESLHMYAQFRKMGMSGILFPVACQGLVVGLLFCLGTAQGGLLSHFSGNHRAVAENPSLKDLDGSASFAVFDRDGAAGDVFGTGLAGFDSLFKRGANSPTQLDTSARYLYLYQTVNDGHGNAGFATSTIDQVSITSWGHWALGFEDFEGVVDVNNPFGRRVSSFEPAAPAILGVSMGVVSNQTGHLDQEPRRVSFSNGNFVAAWSLYNGDPISLVAGNTSSIYGFTSNTPPVVRQLTIESCPDN